VVPYYNKPPQEGLYQHFRAIAGSVDLPIILYNIPGRCVVNMEADTTLRLARDCDNVVAVKEAGAEPAVQAGLLGEVNGKLTAAQEALGRLIQATAQATAMEDVKEQAFFYKDVVRAAMEELRAPIDGLEMIVDKDVWPVPSYGELTFEV